MDLAAQQLAAGDRSLVAATRTTGPGRRRRPPLGSTHTLRPPRTSTGGPAARPANCRRASAAARHHRADHGMIDAPFDEQHRIDLHEEPGLARAGVALLGGEGRARTSTNRGPGAERRPTCWRRLGEQFWVASRTRADRRPARPLGPGRATSDQHHLRRTPVLRPRRVSSHASRSHQPDDGCPWVTSGVSSACVCICGSARDRAPGPATVASTAVGGRVRRSREMRPPRPERAHRLVPRPGQNLRTEQPTIQMRPPVAEPGPAPRRRRPAMVGAATQATAGSTWSQSGGRAGPPPYPNTVERPATLAVSKELVRRGPVRRAPRRGRRCRGVQPPAHAEAAPAGSEPITSRPASPASNGPTPTRAATAYRSAVRSTSFQAR
ncbi:hypothetical protein SALBM311S_04541 [Streptomyces alboniger]